MILVVAILKLVELADAPGRCRYQPDCGLEATPESPWFAGLESCNPLATDISTPSQVPTDDPCAASHHATQMRDELRGLDEGGKSGANFEEEVRLKITTFETGSRDPTAASARPHRKTLRVPYHEVSSISH